LETMVQYRIVTRYVDFVNIFCFSSLICLFSFLNQNIRHYGSEDVIRIIMPAPREKVVFRSNDQYPEIHVMLSLSHNLCKYRPHKKYAKESM